MGALRKRDDRRLQPEADRGNGRRGAVHRGMRNGDDIRLQVGHLLGGRAAVRPVGGGPDGGGAADRDGGRRRHLPVGVSVE